MMTRCCTRGHLSRPPHPTSPKRPSIRNNLIYHLWSILLHWFLLSLLQCQPISNPWNWWMLTTNRHHTPQPIWSPTFKHGCSSSLWSLSNLSPPQHYTRRPQRGYSSLSPHDSSWPLFYYPPSNRILWSTIHNCWRNLRIYILCSYWISRPSCHYRYSIPFNMPITTN